jgi:MFS family permease
VSPPLPPSEPTGTTRVWRVRAFVVLWVNAAVVFLGVMAQNVARTWLAFELMGTNAALGGVLLSFGVAMLLSTPWGGVAADRLPKRLVIQAALLLLLISSASIGVAVLADVIEYWMLIAASVLQAIGFALFTPARTALLAELLPQEAMPRAVSLLLVNAEVNRVIGPALAGLAISAMTFGTEIVFLAGALLFAVGMVLALALPAGRRRGDPPARSPLGELADGVRYVRARRDLLALLWCGIGVTMAGLPYLAFLPTVAADLFGTGAAGYGILSASSAVGAVVAGLFLGRPGHHGDRRRMLIAGGVVFGLALAAMAFAPGFTAAVVILVVLGGALLTFQTTNQALLISLTDMEFQGRLQGLVMLSFGAFGVAALPLGVLADAVGLRWTLAGMGVVVLGIVTAFGVVGRRTLRPARLVDLG